VILPPSVFPGHTHTQTDRQTDRERESYYVLLGLTRALHALYHLTWVCHQLKAKSHSVLNEQQIRF